MLQAGNVGSRGEQKMRRVEPLIRLNQFKARDLFDDQVTTTRSQDKGFQFSAAKSKKPASLV
jgi:hypothetical protein